MSSFYQKLNQSWDKQRSLLCVGLDPDFRNLPAAVKRSAQPILDFNRTIIDATAQYACAFKPQIAYYAAAGAEDQLEQTIQYIKTQYPHLPVILDAKRGDIGSTADMYALEAFERYRVDAVTVNPYMGGDTISPFSSYAERGVVLLCRTSNPGSGDIQELESEGTAIYKHVARLAANYWNNNQNICMVVGATFPEILSEVRDIVGDMPLLVPGIGAQGGDLDAVLKHGLDSKNTGLLINVSRGIMYAGVDGDFAEAASTAAQSYCHRINEIRAKE